MHRKSDEGQFVCTIRLSDDLLELLTTYPKHVSILWKKSVPIIQVKEKEFELLSFDEDANLHECYQLCKKADAVHCPSPWQDLSDDGYSLYQIGRVHKKLLVQRQLNAKEKDRIKTRQEKSVVESRARKSVLLPSGSNTKHRMHRKRNITSISQGTELPMAVQM